MVEICILLSKEHFSLSKAEVENVLCNPKTTSDLNLLKFKANVEIVDKLDKTAFSKKAFEILESAESYPELEKKLENNNYDYGKSKTFGIRTLNLTEEPSHFDVVKIAKLIYSDTLGEVDLKKPEQEFYLILAENAYFARKIWQNTDKPSARSPKNRPAPHPTSMNPKFARALINLANPSKELIDPFCGSGGIMLEAGVLGLRTFGIDLDSAMIERAEKNLKHYNIKNYDLIVGDALNWDKKVECAVTDVPYGKSSKLKEKLKGLIQRFLAHYKGLTQKIVLVAPETMNAEKIAKSEGWQVKQNFKIYVHNTLTREILVLER